MGWVGGAPLLKVPRWAQSTSRWRLSGAESTRIAYQPLTSNDEGSPPVWNHGGFGAFYKTQSKELLCETWANAYCITGVRKVTGILANMPQDSAYLTVRITKDAIGKETPSWMLRASSGDVSRLDTTPLLLPQPEEFVVSNGTDFMLSNSALKYVFCS